MKFILCFTLVLGSSTGWSQTKASPPTAYSLPSKAIDACKTDCLGYSPSTRTWICPSIRGYSGLAGFDVTECALQLNRDKLVLAELMVLAVDRDMRDQPEQMLKYDQALAIAPADLTPVTAQDLEPGQLLPLPNTRHVLRLDPPSKMNPMPADPRLQPSFELTVLCNRNQKVFVPGSAPGADGNKAPFLRFPYKPRLTKPDEALLFKSRCRSRETFRVLFGPVSSQIALIEIHGLECEGDSAFYFQRRAYPIDLTNACAAPPADGK